MSESLRAGRGAIPWPVLFWGKGGVRPGSWAILVENQLWGMGIKIQAFLGVVGFRAQVPIVPLGKGLLDPDQDLGKG